MVKCGNCLQDGHPQNRCNKCRRCLQQGHKEYQCQNRQRCASCHIEGHHHSACNSNAYNPGTTFDAPLPAQPSATNQPPQFGHPFQRNDQNNQAEQTCFNCDKPGHKANRCPEPKRDQGKFQHKPLSFSGSTKNQRYQKGHKEKEPEELPYDFRGKNVDTDTKKALSEVDKEAQKLVDESKGELTLIDAKNKYGLRTAFAKPDPGLRIVTNYLTMTPPNKIYVYQVDMIRSYATNGRPIKIKKFADRKEVLQVLQAQVPQLNVPASPAIKTWVTDGDLIWSTNPLWPSPNNAGHPVHTAGNLNYHNECGQSLNVQQVDFYYKTPIDVSQIAMAQLFNINQGQTAFKNTDGGILLRGLNAFCSEHARHQGTITFTSGTKAYNNPTASSLGSMIRVLQGFFLSVRPGVDQLLLNIDTASSPFYKLVTVQVVIDGSGRRIKELMPILKGVKVRIMYPIAGGWGFREDIRFINEIGYPVDQEQTILQPEQTVYDWYMSPLAAHMSHAERPTANIPLEDNEGDKYHAIKCAKDTRAHPDEADLEWYPANQLEIIEDQRWSGDLEPGETTNMIKVAQRTPDKNVQQILTNGLRTFNFHALPQASLAPYNMGTGQDLIAVPARFLGTPDVLYRQGRPGPGQGSPESARIDYASWNLKNVHFHSSQRITDLPVLNISGKDFSWLGQLKTLREAMQNHNLLPPKEDNDQLGFVELGKNKNLAFHNHKTNARQYERDILNEMYQYEGNQTLLVALNGHNYDIYASGKRAAELELGLNTVFMQTDKKFSIGNGSNIALKFNLKTKGTNHRLDANQFAGIRATTGHQCDTIVIGADVTHPGAGASPGTPSIAAVVGSTDDEFMHFPGSMRLQRTKCESIVDLGDMVKERLIDWALQHNDRLPARMLFYRDGVSESQYQKLRDYEMPQIDQAYKWAQEYLNWKQRGYPGAGRPGGGPALPPPPKGTLTPATPAASTPPPVNQKRALDHRREPWPIPKVVPKNDKDDDDDDEDDLFEDTTNLTVPYQLTFVVVGKRHKTRFFAQDDKDQILNNPGWEQRNAAKDRLQSTDPRELPEVKNRNVAPGLLVDQVITHPHSFDFYLQSHQPLKGTARSAHYFVLRNDMALTTTQVQNITHDFCYAYARATKGVSYCAPAYYADRLCDRGRAYLRHWLKADDHADFKPSRKINTKTLPKEKQRDYNIFVKNELRDRSYWRPYYRRPYYFHPINRSQNNPDPNPPMKYGFSRRNPWHEALDAVMFYL